MGRSFFRVTGIVSCYMEWFMQPNTVDGRKRLWAAMIEAGGAQFEGWVRSISTKPTLDRWRSGEQAVRSATWKEIGAAFSGLAPGIIESLRQHVADLMP